jgi:serine/threonine-protein kinase
MDPVEESAGRDGAAERATAALRFVFISYASQDVAAADNVCAALEKAGQPCWIAPRDVRPGEPYAAAIVEAINACRMLVLVLTKHAIDSPHVLREIERASSKKRPVLSIRLDETPLRPELEYFLSANHWLDASAKSIESVVPALVESVRGRATGHSGAAPLPAAAAAPAKQKPDPWRSGPVLVLAGLVLALLGYFAVDKLWLSKSGAGMAAGGSPPPIPPAAGNSTPAPGGSAPPFAPPAHSIAVLPFTNMSGVPQQDYFSDGLSEELLNSLAAIPDLRVAARTSSFTFKGKNDDVADIAHKLNVGAVLEGSVRKDGNHLRITAQLINATTGFHLWSKTYDRDLKNVLALQTEIAEAVTKSLEATLLADAAATIEIGGTQNPAAFDAYLRGRSLERGHVDKDSLMAMIAAYSEAARLDPKFAKAYVGMEEAQNIYANNFAPFSEVRPFFTQARQNAEKAVALAPGLATAHAAMAAIWERADLDFGRAQVEYDRALALSPNDVDVLLRSGFFLTSTGRVEAGLANIRKAVALDQLNAGGYRRLSFALTDARRYRESIEAADRALQFDPADTTMLNSRGFDFLMLGNLDAARENCVTPKPTWLGRLCAALLYDRLHDRAKGEAQLAAMQGELGNSAAYQYAEIQAQWGNLPKAMEWLETAFRVRDPGLLTLRSDVLIDPLRQEPRFREIERELNFPN